MGSDQSCSKNKLTHTRARSYLLWPESTPLLCVLQIVSDNVGLLQEQSHGVGQLYVTSHLRVLKLRC